MAMVASTSTGEVVSRDKAVDDWEDCCASVARVLRCAGGNVRDVEDCGDWCQLEVIVEVEG